MWRAISFLNSAMYSALMRNFTKIRCIGALSSEILVTMLASGRPTGKDWPRYRDCSNRANGAIDLANAPARRLRARRNKGRLPMRKVFVGVAAAALCASVAVPPSQAEDHPTVGLVAAFSGAYAMWGDAYKREIDLYMFQHDGKGGNPKINLILRDTPGTDYARTKQVVQEFITRDNAAVVGGGEFTPEALAVAPLVAEAKIPYVIFNGATSFIVDKSPYLVLVGFTIWQPNVPLAIYAVEHGCKRATLVVADYAPGKDTIDALTYGFQKANQDAKVNEVIKVPLGTTDFSAYMQRLKDSKPQCVIPFMPGGPMSLTFAKDFAQMGFAKSGVVLYDAGGITAENQLDSMGDAALGIISTAPYSTYLNNPMNHAFIEALAKKTPNIRREFVPVD